MKAPTRFFLVCFGLAALAVAGDYFYLRYLESHLTTAVAACEAESNRLSQGKKGRYVLEETADESIQQTEKPAGPWDAYAKPESGIHLPSDWRNDPIAGLVCEPSELSTAGYDLKKISAIQKIVLEAYRSKASFDAETVGIVSVIALLLLGILPHAWYFLLRRLREVAASIRGE